MSKHKKTGGKGAGAATAQPRASGGGAPVKEARAPGSGTAESPDATMAPASLMGRKFVLAFLALSFAVVLYLSFRIFQPFLEMFIIATATASLTYPAFERITRWVGGRPNLGAALTLLLVVLVVVLPTTGYSSVLSREATNLAKGLDAATIQEYVNKATDRFLPKSVGPKGLIGKYFGPGGILGSSYFKEAMNRLAGAANTLVQGFVAGAATALLNLLLFFMFLFFLLRDGRALGLELMRLSPLDDRVEREIFHHLTKTIRGVLLGGVIVPIMQGILAMILFASFGLPSPILWGSLVIVAAVIPFVGSALIWAPASIYLALTGASTPRWLGLLICCAVLIGLSDNLVKPLILREAANFHPLIAFVSILGGLAAFGIFGFVLGPIIASLLLSLIRIYKYEVIEAPAS